MLGRPKLKRATRLKLKRGSRPKLNRSTRPILGARSDQIIGELRLFFSHVIFFPRLKGHQIIGELRQIAGQLPLSVDVYIVVIPSNATYFLINNNSLFINKL